MILTSRCIGEKLKQAQSRFNEINPFIAQFHQFFFYKEQYEKWKQQGITDEFKTEQLRTTKCRMFILVYSNAAIADIWAIFVMTYQNT